MSGHKAFWLFVMLPISAHAEPANVPTKEGQTWQHKASKFAFPPDVGTYKRAQIRDFSEGKLIDIVATYRDEGSRTHATLYIYRPALPEMPLWFDISNWYIQRNGQFGQVAPYGGPTAFGLSADGRSVALRQAYSISLIGRSSGVATAAYGRWIVKLRMTSPTLEPAALGEALRSFMTALPWRPQILVTADQVPLGPCLNPLSSTGKAEQIKQDSALVMVGAMLAMAASDLEDNGASKPRLCRDDSTPKTNFPLYQLDEGSTGYLIAIGDNGTVMTVMNDQLSSSVAAKNAKEPSAASKPFYRVTRMTPVQWEQYAAFAQLPAPQQAFDTIDNSNPASVTTVGDKGSKTTINTTAVN